MTPEKPMLASPALAGHLRWLESISTGPDAGISSTTAMLAAKAWLRVYEASEGRIPIPAACTGPDGEMFYSWDKGRHHLELEIIPEQPAEWFYRDRETGQFWGEDHIIGDPIPEAVLGVLPLFCDGGLPHHG